MSDIQFSDFSGEPRRRIVTLTSSNASVPIPEWAQGGKGIVFITGCGGGASGGVEGSSASSRGGGGGAGAWAFKLPMLIPSSTSTISVTIGSNGAAKTATANSNGNSGGDTIVTVGSLSLYLGGGNGGGASIAGTGGVPNFGSSSILTPTGSVTGPFSYSTSSGTSLINNGILNFGASGGDDATATAGYGAGAISMFGAGGTAVSSVSGRMVGIDATGYGAGGSGGTTGGTGISTDSGAGSPGLIILEFVEGF